MRAQRRNASQQWSTAILRCFVGIALLWGCAPTQDVSGPDQHIVDLPDTRLPIAISAEASRQHRTVMLQHLETIQAIVAAVVEEDFERAQGLTEAHLGFFMHRQEVMAEQQPERFPPAYHDLAMAHHEAAEELGRVMPTHDLKQILPKLDGVLKACVGCHLEYRVSGE